MLTICAIPKPFHGEFWRIQHNAIRSWARLRPVCEIVLLGEEDGTLEMAAEIGAIHVPEVRRNEYGTPLLSSVLLIAQQRASYGFVCYLNADIILLDDFLPAIERAFDDAPSCLIVGRRWDLDLTDDLQFAAGWETELRARALQEGSLQPINAIDYFAFPRHFWGAIPDFAIGRTAWDQWLIYQARSQHSIVVDATPCITIIHQRHGYSHHAGGKEEIWKGSEAQRNLSLAGGYCNAYTLRDATHRLTQRGVSRRVLSLDPRRVFIQPVVTSSWSRPIIRLFRSFVQTQQASEH